MFSLIRNSLQQIGVREISEAADGEQLARVRVSAGFRLTAASAEAWVDGGYRRPG